MATGDDTRDKAVRLFTYLQEFVQLRSRVTRDCSDYRALLWFYEIPREHGCFSIAWGTGRDDDVWIEMKRKKEPPCPPVQKICEMWVDPNGLHNSDTEPQLRERILDPDSTDDSGLVFRELRDHPEVQEPWLQYLIEKWTPWAEEHRKWQGVHKVYQRLYAIYVDQKRIGEEYEIALGLGLLTWKTPSEQRVRRHIMVGQATLSFDANTGTIAVRPGSEGVKLALETDMLEPIERPPIEEQLRIEEIIQGTAESPWERLLIEPVLRGWVHPLDAQACYNDNLEPLADARPTPQMAFAPCLILRKRTARSLVRSFSAIIDKFKDGGEIPFEVQRLCQIIDDRPGGGAEEGPDSIDTIRRPIDSEVYFSLPANEEQFQIVERLDSRQGVLVQGPPGTGKSHIIANLICHILTQGKRVLISSQTPRALRVLKGKIPKQMAALCVSVLGNDTGSFQELEDSVREIADRYHNWNASTSDREISKLQEQIDTLRKKRAEIELCLREYREQQTYRHSIAGGVYGGTALSIARAIAEAETIHAWFPDAINEDIEIPFGSPLFQKLLEVYRRLTPERCEVLSKNVVSLDQLPDVAQFLQLVQQEQDASEKRLQYQSVYSRPTFQFLLRTNRTIRNNMKQTLQAFQVEMANVRERSSSWVSSAVDNIVAGNDRPWKELQGTSAKMLRGLRERAQWAQGQNTTVPAGIDRHKLRADAEIMVSHLNAGGGVGWWILRKTVVKERLYLTGRGGNGIFDTALRVWCCRGENRNLSAEVAG